MADVVASQGLSRFGSYESRSGKEDFRPCVFPRDLEDIEAEYDASFNFLWVAGTAVSECFGRVVGPERSKEFHTRSQKTWVTKCSPCIIHLLDSSRWLFNISYLWLCFLKCGCLIE